MESFYLFNFFRSFFIMMDNREIVIKDESIKTTIETRIKADSSNLNYISVSMPGTVIKVLVEKGEKVSKGDLLMITEAMKMETTVQAPFAGIVKDTYVKNGNAIQIGDLLIELLNYIRKRLTSKNYINCLLCQLYSPKYKYEIH
ncbi:hypothetical protein CW306_25040 [Bacillus sp. BA3]|nr:hypothetical protein CW306_25040 [Bacillus sp. BA3]